MEKRGTRQTRRAASAAAGKGGSAPGVGSSAAAGASPELESVAEAASAAAAEPARDVWSCMQLCEGGKGGLLKPVTVPACALTPQGEVVT